MMEFLVVIVVQGTNHEQNIEVILSLTEQAQEDF